MNLKLLRRITALVVAVSSCFIMDASATGNIKPGYTVFNTFKTAMDAPWDTTISVTASTLDTLQSRGNCSYISVCSNTLGMAFACRAVGDQGLVNVSSTSTLGGRVPAVNYKLTTWVVAGTEYFCKTYGPLPTQQLFGVIIDGTATGSITVTFEP